MQSIALSRPHFDGRKYFNPFPNFPKHSTKDILKWMIWDRITGRRKNVKPGSAYPELVRNNPSLLKQNHHHFSVTWIGHSTLLIQMDGVNILTDPIFSKRCSPISFAGPKRLVPPGMDLDNLPKVDLVIISHDHYDHLDKSTITALGNDPYYVVPLGVGQILKTWGITHYRELDWWGEVTFQGIAILCTPAQHFSGRTPFRQNATLWASWLLKGKEFTFYFGGDSGYFPGYNEIASQGGPIDFAALPIGAYKPCWFLQPVHMNPAQALQAFEELNAKYFIPIHWGTFRLGDESIDEPPKFLRKKAIEMNIPLQKLWILKHGETKFFKPEVQMKLSDGEYCY